MDNEEAAVGTDLSRPVSISTTDKDVINWSLQAFLTGALAQLASAMTAMLYF
jgi:hypothetical protein